VNAIFSASGPCQENIQLGDFIPQEVRKNRNKSVLVCWTYK